jgi:hypothetical protein
MLALLALLASAAGAPLDREVFALETPAPVVVEFVGLCPGCNWGRRGYEAAALTLSVDGVYSQHVWLVRGEQGEYRVALGLLPAGPHSLTFAVDAARSARHVRSASVRNVVVKPAAEGTSEARLLAHAPVLVVRPNTLGRFSDLPLLMWTESGPADAGGLRLRYSVVFSNEDGGTPPDRLMATWGRLTDIEYVLGVELDASGAVASEQYQGPGHALLPFAGARDAGRPVLYVVTDNNMVADRGKEAVRMAPAPFLFDLSGVSREAVMDAHPWTYAVSAREARRERRVREDARPGSNRLPDPRRFATLEACAATQDATIAFSVGVRGSGGATHYYDSDAGVPAFRIGRRPTEFPNGCFRGAVALPPGTEPSDLVALRLRAFTRIARKNEPSVKEGSGSARLLRVNTLFLLGADDQPGPGLFSWRGDEPLRPEGPPLELVIPPGRAGADHDR